MGKRKGGTNHNSRGKKRIEVKDQSNKRRKQRRKFWIEICKENKVPKSVPPDMVIPVTISRVELSDNHMHGSLSTEMGGEDNNVNSRFEAIPTPMISHVILQDERQAKVLEKKSTENQTIPVEESNNTISVISGNRGSPRKGDEKLTIITTNDQIQLEKKIHGNDAPKLAYLMKGEGNKKCEKNDTSDTMTTVKNPLEKKTVPAEESNNTISLISGNRGSPKNGGDKMTIITTNDQVQLEKKTYGNDDPKPAYLMKGEGNKKCEKDDARDTMTTVKNPFVKVIKCPSAKGRAKVRLILVTVMTDFFLTSQLT